MRKFKLLRIQIDHLISLFDESLDIWDEEHLFLFDPTAKLEVVTLDERRKHNEIKIKKTIEEASNRLATFIPKKTQQTIQHPIFRMD